MRRPHYLNVDLDIESRHDLRPLVKAPRPDVMVLHSDEIGGQYLVRVESTAEHRGPDAAIETLCKLLHRLPPSPRKLLDSARKKVFDIGYEGSPKARVWNVAFRTRTLRRLTELGATFAISFYPREPERKLPSRAR